MPLLNYPSRLSKLLSSTRNVSSFCSLFRGQWRTPKSLVQDVNKSTSSPHNVFWKSTGEENYRMSSHSKELALGLTLTRTFLKCLLPSLNTLGASSLFSALYFWMPQRENLRWELILLCSRQINDRQPGWAVLHSARAVGAEPGVEPGTETVLFVWLNSCIEVKFTYYKIHPF